MIHNIRVLSASLKPVIKKVSPFFLLFLVFGIFGLVGTSIGLVWFIYYADGGFYGKPAMFTFLVWGMVFLGYLVCIFSPRVRRYLIGWTIPGYFENSILTTYILAIWFGLMTGFARILVVDYRKLIGKNIEVAGFDMIWFWPLGEIILLSLVGSVILLLSRRFKRLSSLETIITVFGAISLLSFMMVDFGLATYAVVLLSIGLAVAGARIAVAYRLEFFFVIYHTLGWLWPMKTKKTPIGQGEKVVANQTPLSRREFLICTGTFIGGTYLAARGFGLLEDLQTPGFSRTMEPGSPNVFLIVMDTVRAQNMSLYGYQRATTPNLEQIARAGVTFENVISPCSWTLPSHASMFTGRYPHELSVSYLHRLDDTYPTLAETLRDQGYSTAGFISNTIYCGRDFGLNRGFNHYEDFLTDLPQVILGSKLTSELWQDRKLRGQIGFYRLPGFKDAAHMNRNVIDWLDRQKDGRPFFVFINYNDAHSPYAPPIEFARKYSSHRPNGIINEDDLSIGSYTPEQITDFQDAYDGSISYLDHHIGQLISHLQDRDLLDNTLLVIVADHGEQFGEHNLLLHGNSLYTQVTHVPLIMHFPGRIQAGTKVMDRATSRDLPATVLDMLGLPNSMEIPGVSLASHFSYRPTSSVKSPLISSVKPIKGGWSRSIVVDGMHFIYSDDGRQELFNLDYDPLEKVDIAKSVVGQSIVKEMQPLMNQLFS